MTYVMSDIHGCYDKYTAMLDTIKFSDSDTLYVLGDVVDRGDNPIKVLQDMNCRANVLPIMGNHDYIAYVMLRKLSVEITADNCDSYMDADFLQDVSLWLSDGGSTTLDEFKQLNPSERGDVLEYLQEFTPCEKITVNGRKYILTHAGIPKAAAYDNLEKYHILGFVTATTDYNKKYFDDVFLVTGHTPTGLIDAEYKNKVYRKNNHIAIDCGAVFGGFLSCVCLETDEEFYI